MVAQPEEALVVTFTRFKFLASCPAQEHEDFNPSKRVVAAVALHLKSRVLGSDPTWLTNSPGSTNW